MYFAYQRRMLNIYPFINQGTNLNNFTLLEKGSETILLILNKLNK